MGQGLTQGSRQEGETSVSPCQPADLSTFHPRASAVFQVKPARSRLFAQAPSCLQAIRIQLCDSLDTGPRYNLVPLLSLNRSSSALRTRLGPTGQLSSHAAGHVSLYRPSTGESLYLLLGSLFGLHT
jgi:hypothetical protein